MAEKTTTHLDPLQFLALMCFLGLMWGTIWRLEDRLITIIELLKVAHGR